MSQKERVKRTRKVARNLAKEIKTTGKQPTVKEVMKRTGTSEGNSNNMLRAAKAYLHKEKVELLISQLETGNIPGFKPICSLEDISKQKASE
jgi:hydroxypyruvate isomerase